MGLGLLIGSQVTRASGGKRSIKKLFEAIEKEIRTALGDPLIERLASFHCDDDRLVVGLHPAEEGVEFTVRDDGYLVCSAKTSSAGPGYHAMLVDLLRRIEGPCGLAWQWSNEELEFMDETGFAEHGDHRRLQLEMLTLMTAIADSVLRDEQGESYALSVSMDYQVAGDFFARSPLGFWQREWFEKVASAEPESLFAEGARYYPWWNEARDSLFWLNCGLVKLWQDIRWHIPANEAEAADCELTLKCFARVKAIDPGLRLPAEIRELQALLESDEESSPPPAPEGIGFRRRVLWQYPFRGWSIRVPGYFYEDNEDEGSTAVYWHNDKTIRVSTLAIEGEEGRPSADELAELSEDEAPSGEAVLKFSDGDRRAQAVVSLHDDGDERYGMLQGRMATAGHLCFCTICFGDEADRAWAIDTWQSIRGPEASGEDE